jgi:hypothetical protein
MQHAPQSPAATPPVLAEAACTATLLVVAFLFFRWWQRDAAYTRRQRERDALYQTTGDASPSRSLQEYWRPARASRKSSVTSQASTRAAPWRRPSASIASPMSGPVSPPTPFMQSGPDEDRCARKERLQARAAELLALLDQTAGQDPSAGQQSEMRAGQRPQLCHTERALHAVVSWSESCCVPPPSPVQRSASFGRAVSVSGASRYTAQLIKRRASTEAVSPVGISPVSSSGRDFSSSGCLQ